MREGYTGKIMMGTILFPPGTRNPRVVAYGHEVAQRRRTETCNSIYNLLNPLVEGYEELLCAGQS